MNPREVVVYDTEGRKHIYNSITECSEAEKISQSYLKVLISRGGTVPTGKFEGFRFMYREGVKK